MLTNLRDYFAIKHSGLFDEKYYLLHNPDVRRADINPLKHFMKYGWKEGRNPSESFNTNFYIENHPSVKSDNINPLVHYIRHHGKEGKPVNQSLIKRGFRKLKRIFKQTGPISTIKTATNGSSKNTGNLCTVSGFGQFNDQRFFISTWEVYNKIMPLPVTEKVDIIICIGPNPVHARACVASIRKFTKADTYDLHFVVHEADRGKITDLISDDVYVHTHQMELFNYSFANNIVLKDSHNDVVLLNDDTEVTEGWLEKLRVASKGVCLTGAHTGFQCSGNPQMWGEGPIRLTNFPVNMFCAYIPKRVREVVGLLNEEFEFYGGEDVDYSIRALTNGFPLVISEAFVLHKDNQSFGETKEKLMMQSDRLLFEKYAVSAPFDLSGFIPKVSVIVTTRNRPSLLQAAIESIEQIDYPNFEIIVVDDDSESQTINLLFELQEKYKNITQLRAPINVGSAEARLLGVQIAKGQFVLFADDDDTVLKNRISDPLEMIIGRPELDVVYCNYNIVTADGSVTPIFCEPFNMERYLKLEFYIGLGILLGRKDAFINVPFYSIFNRASDYDWVFRLIRRGYKIDLCPQIVMNYNRTGSVDEHLAGNKASMKQHEEIYEREILLRSVTRINK
jgi:GT2 family glycosyltransferase